MMIEYKCWYSFGFFDVLKLSPFAEMSSAPLITLPSSSTGAICPQGSRRGRHQSKRPKIKSSRHLEKAGISSYRLRSLALWSRRVLRAHLICTWDSIIGFWTKVLERWLLCFFNRTVPDTLEWVVCSNWACAVARRTGEWRGCRGTRRNRETPRWRTHDLNQTFSLHCYILCLRGNSFSEIKMVPCLPRGCPSENGK